MASSPPTPLSGAEELESTQPLTICRALNFGHYLGAMHLRSSPPSLGRLLSRAVRTKAEVHGLQEPQQPLPLSCRRARLAERTPPPPPPSGATSSSNRGPQVFLGAYFVRSSLTKRVPNMAVARRGDEMGPIRWGGGGRGPTLQQHRVPPLVQLPGAFRQFNGSSTSGAQFEKHCIITFL